MLSLPPSIASAIEWQLEEHMIPEFPCDGLFASYNPIETDTSHASSTSSPRLQFSEYDDVRYMSSAIKEQPNSVKKSTHNEYERDRRKKLNELYSSLRALLPEKDQRKKLSIPCTITHVLKYIPELQGHIERLQRTKEELLLTVSTDEFVSTGTKDMINPMISAICLNRREIMMQICILNTNARIPFSKVANILEREGLQLLNATTHATHADETFFALHLQAKEAMRMEGQMLCEQVMKYLR